MQLKTPTVMGKIESVADLQKLRGILGGKYNLQGKSNDPDARIYIRVAMATCGIASGAREVMETFIEEFAKRNIDAVVTQTGCMGYCYAEPTIEVRLPGREPVVFGFVDLKKADQIIEKYIKNGELVDGIIPVNYETIDLMHKED